MRMILCSIALATTASTVGAVGVSARAGAAPAWSGPGTTVTVSGAVAAPHTYTSATLAGLGEQSYPVTNPGRGPASVTGVGLESVAEASAP